MAKKRPYSIWRKMERKHLSLAGYFRLSVLVGTVDQCYRAIGIVHRTGGPFGAVQGLFRRQAE
jgi:GTP pyrophosphokinase